MKALYFDGERLAAVDDHPEPRLDPGEAIIRPSLAGICATDIEICRGYMGYRGVLGHEFVGVVEQVHAGSDDATTLVGRRVVGGINCACGDCDMCGRGLPTHCRSRTVLGILGRDGSFAERFVLPVENLHPVPDQVPDTHAVFTEPAAAACNAAGLVDPATDRSITVVGDGRLGLLTAQVLALHDRVRVVGKHPENLALCHQWGLETETADTVKPAADQDVVVDCTGAASGLDLSIALARPCGKVILKTTVAGQDGTDLAPIVIDELRVLGSRCGRMEEGLALLSRGALDVESLIHSRWPLDRGLEALEEARRPGVLKVLVELR